MTTRAKGDRKGKRTRHISLTDMASQVYTQLLNHSIIAYPGPISAQGGGSETNITLTSEANRYRITISHAGTQTLYIYGAVDRTLLEQVLRRFVGIRLKMRNTHC